MMTPAITTLVILFLASELHAGGGQETSQDNVRNGRGKGPTLEDVKAAQCPTTAPFKCVEANGYCYNFTQYCDRGHNEVKSCFVEVTDVEEFCRSAKSPINPQCRYACLDQLGWNITEKLLLATQEPPVDFSQSKCPLYTCRNSTSTECYVYDSYCNSAGVVKSCFPEGIHSRDDRLKWCQSSPALLNAQCKHACHYQFSAEEISERSHSKTSDLVPHLYIIAILIVVGVVVGVKVSWHRALMQLIAMIRNWTGRNNTTDSEKDSCHDQEDDDNHPNEGDGILKESAPWNSTGPPGNGQQPNKPGDSTREPLLRQRSRGPETIPIETHDKYSDVDLREMQRMRETEGNLPESDTTAF